MARPLISIRVVPDRSIPEALDRGAKVGRRELTRFITRYVVRGTSNIVEKTPVGSSGALRGGYAWQVRGKNTRRVRGIITNPALYHDVREEGRRAGRMPPPAALIAWVGTKLGVPPEARRGVAFLVARKIGRVGYPGAHMVEKGVKKTRRQMQPEAKKLGLKVVKGMQP